MTASFPAPALVQGSDEDVIEQLARAVYPELVQRNDGENGLRIEIEGDYLDESTLEEAARRFQIMLGVLRAYIPTAGQRADELRPGIGKGSIRDEKGNQVIKLNGVLSHNRFDGDIDKFGQRCKQALQHSARLEKALWLFGRRDRNSADFYMIYEYAEADFFGRPQISKALGISVKDLARLTNSANNLAPCDGGRHAKENNPVTWRLDEQQNFISDLLKRWITYLATKET